MQKKPGREPPTIYTVADAARLLKVRESKVRAAIRAKQLRAARIGRLWRILETDLIKYFEKNVV